MNLTAKIFLFLCLALVWLAPMPVQAQAANQRLKAPVIAILDMRVVKRDSISGKAVQAFLNGKRRAHKDLIAAEEKALRSAWEELSRQRSILSPQAFQVRERAFREKETAAKRKIVALEQALQRDLRATLIEVDKIVGEKMRPIIDQVIESKGIDIIMANQDLIYAKATYNITGEILKGIDKVLPSLDVQALANKALQKKKP